MRVRLVVIPVLVGALGYGVGIAQPVVVRPPLVVGQDAISDSGSTAAAVTVEDHGGSVIHVHSQGPARVVLILYPGGLVRPQAYEWLGRALAADGVDTWVPEMPVDLAVLAKDRADALLPVLPQGVPVVLAGHSLGGAMAADYASRHADRLAGLVLLGAYPAEDVRVQAAWSALSLAAEHDGLASRAKVQAGLGRLPAGSRLVTVPGAVHAFFGRYGPQAGDGLSTVSRAEAEAGIVAAVRAYLAAVR